MAKVYLLTQADLDSLEQQMEIAFRDVADRHRQQWNLMGVAGQPPTVYDAFKTANYVVHTWKSKVT